MEKILKADTWTIYCQNLSEIPKPNYGAVEHLLYGKLSEK